MKCTVILAILAVTLGAGMLIYADQIPVYTDEAAPYRLSSELQELPEEERFLEWYKQLAEYETPHKYYSDFGRGLVSSGIGLLCATLLIYVYLTWPQARRFWLILFVWAALWAIRVPLSSWYYEVRQNRFDYPAWGDSIVIGIMSDTIAWIALGVISSFFLLLLRLRHPLPNKLSFNWPASTWGRIRFLIIASWILLNGLCIYEGTRYGNEGMTFTCMVASSVLLIMLASKEYTESSRDFGVGPPSYNKPSASN